MEQNEKHNLIDAKAKQLLVSFRLTGEPAVDLKELAKSYGTSPGLLARWYVQNGIEGFGRLEQELVEIQDGLGQMNRLVEALQATKADRDDVAAVRTDVIAVRESLQRVTDELASTLSLLGVPNEA